MKSTVVDESLSSTKLQFCSRGNQLAISNLDTLILNPEEALGILDLRSLGYYKINQGVIQQKLSRFYNFKLAEEVCMQFNNLINMIRKGQKAETEENTYG